MSFAPLVPFSGSVGWSFLQRTRAVQQEAHSASPALQRNVRHFEAKIASVTTAKDLVADRALLSVALGAFGLDGDINNRFYVQKILESDIGDPRSLANRLTDKRYLAFAQAFGFAEPGGPKTAGEGFAQKLVTSYKDRQFEQAVGEQNNDLRLVMGLERDLGALNDRTLSDNAKWYTVMATPPLRAVFEAALGLPKSFGALPLERQLSEFRDRAQRIFGVSEVSGFRAPEKLQELSRLFLVRSDLGAGGGTFTKGSGALTLLQSARRAF